MKIQKAEQQGLPPDVVEADLSYDSSHRLDWKELPEGTTYHLTFYQVGGEGARSKQLRWVLCTLNISGKGKGQTERYYGIEVETQQVCRVGRGPHVVKVVTVYLSKKNLKRLQRYVDLHQSGLAQAGSIRDRISTRRAIGQQKRAEGRTTWWW